MNAQRFLTLINHMKLQSDEHFNIGSITHVPYDINTKEAVKALIEHDCGTTCCVIGELPRAFPDFWEYYKPPYLYIMVKPINSSSTILAQEVADFLDIALECVNSLFYPTGYSKNPTLSQVINSMEQFYAVHIQ